MKGIFIIFLFCFSSVFAQQIYQPHEVDTQATPSGGQQLFNHFVSSNLNIPIHSSFKGINARVFINAIVETDGSISNVSVLKGGDSLLNAEAIRVVQLYKAWKPAVLKEVAVRQATSLPIVLKRDPIIAYDSVTKSLVTYFDKKMVETSNDGKVKYRRSIPVDDRGAVNGNVLYTEKTGNEWKILSSEALEMQEFWQKSSETGNEDSVRAIRKSIILQEKNTLWRQSVVYQENGGILSYEEFKSNHDPVRNKYYLNGQLRESNTHQDKNQQVIGWHTNGQLASVILMPVMYNNPFIYQIKDVRTSDGQQQVIDGNGYACIEMDHYTTQGLDGCGTVKNGLKDGVWRSKSKGGILLFEEHYKNGVLVKGTSFTSGQYFDYVEIEAQPMYHGGVQEMYKYIGRNLRYPTDAAKKGIQGRVYTSFVVDVDGSVKDVKLEKGILTSLDNEALRIIEGMNGKWSPGLQRGRKVKVKYNLPIVFALE